MGIIGKVFAFPVREGEMAGFNHAIDFGSSFGVSIILKIGHFMYIKLLNQYNIPLLILNFPLLINSI